MHWKKHHLKQEKLDRDSDNDSVLTKESAKKMAVSQLREEMRKRGLVCTGQKKALIQRLSEAKNVNNNQTKKENI